VNEFKELSLTWSNKLKTLEDHYSESFEKLKKQIQTKANSKEVMEKLFKGVFDAANSVDHLQKAVNEMFEFVPV